jgi:hypothetical protein
MPAPRPAAPAPRPVAPAPRITMWHGEDGRWMAHLYCNGVYSHSIRDTREEAHAACVKFWREHTREGRNAK